MLRANTTIYSDLGILDAEAGWTVYVGEMRLADMARTLHGCPACAENPITFVIDG